MAEPFFTQGATMPDDFIGRPGDFDFLLGRWTLTNRRLKQRHAGSDDWDVFPGTTQAWSHLGGIVSVDENVFPTQGWSGLSLRSLDIAAGRWSIWWIDSRTGRLFPPVHGGWAGDRGEFYGDDDDGGRPVQVRFVWQRLGADRARWEQAFALAGDAWETNWIIELERATAP
jgi:hypothetical protein